MLCRQKKIPSKRKILQRKKEALSQKSKENINSNRSANPEISFFPSPFGLLRSARWKFLISRLAGMSKSTLKGGKKMSRLVSDWPKSSFFFFFLMICQMTGGNRPDWSANSAGRRKPRARLKEKAAFWGFLSGSKAIGGTRSVLL